jgi:MFS family permease
MINLLAIFHWQESVGHLTTAVAVLPWGRFSDKRGRKPVLLTCSVGLAVAITGFGYSNTFLALVFFKFLEGLFKANKPTVKTVLAELSEGDESKMARAFSLLPAIYAAAATLGWVGFRILF